MERITYKMDGGFYWGDRKLSLLELCEWIKEAEDLMDFLIKENRELKAQIKRS
jgi:hypothetical protein